MYVLVDVDRFREWLLEPEKTLKAKHGYIAELLALDNLPAVIQRELLGLNFKSTIYSTREILDCIRNKYNGIMDNIELLTTSVYSLEYIIERLDVVLSEKPFIPERKVKHIPIIDVLSAIIETVKKEKSTFNKNLKKRRKEAEILATIAIG